VDEVHSHPTHTERLEDWIWAPQTRQNIAGVKAVTNSRVL